VDEVYWYIAPRICGGGTPSLAGPALSQSIELKNLTVHPMGDNVMMHGFPTWQSQPD
jgi:diaminohydroxyphosphoribosylaminopyrimidine deaminase/5-amino-6-(5-phosphoribosylamino)uracil reductase